MSNKKISELEPLVSASDEDLFAIVDVSETTTKYISGQNLKNSLFVGSGSSVETYDNLAGFPETGANNKLYIAKDTNKLYRWESTQYVEVSVSSGGGSSSSSMVYRTVDFSGSKVNLKGLGDQSDLDGITVSFTGGNNVTISNVSSSLKLIGLTFFLNSNVNSSTSMTFVYPEISGATSLAESNMPLTSLYNSAGTVQANTAWTVSNSSGSMNLVKTSLVANSSYYFVVNF